MSVNHKYNMIVILTGSTSSNSVAILEVVVVVFVGVW